MGFSFFSFSSKFRMYRKGQDRTRRCANFMRFHGTVTEDSLAFTVATSNNNKRLKFPIRSPGEYQFRVKTGIGTMDRWWQQASLWFRLRKSTTGKSVSADPDSRWKDRLGPKPNIEVVSIWWSTPITSGRPVTSNRRQSKATKCRWSSIVKTV